MTFRIQINLAFLVFAQAFQSEIQSVSTLDVWNTGGIQVAIRGKFSSDFDTYKYRVWFGEHEAPVLFGRSGTTELIVASPVLAKTIPTGDHQVKINYETAKGISDVKWSPTANALHQKIRIHNYDSTVKHQAKLAQEAQQKQAAMLSSRHIPSFSDTLMLNTFYSKERDDHTLCGIGGDNFAICPSRGAGYQILRTEGQCSRVRIKGETKPLKFYYNKKTKDNAVAVKKSTANVQKHSFVRVDCYVWINNGSGERVPLVLYYNKNRRDHLATATAGGRDYALANNYTSLGVQGYVLPPPKPRPPSGMSDTSKAVLKKLDNLIALHTSHKALLKKKQGWSGAKT